MMFHYIHDLVSMENNFVRFSVRGGDRNAKSTENRVELQIQGFYEMLNGLFSRYLCLHLLFNIYLFAIWQQEPKRN